MSKLKWITVTLVLTIGLISIFTYNTFSEIENIEPALQQEIDAGKGQVEVLIYMNDQVNTEKIAALARKEPGFQKKEVRTTVAEKLKQTAEKTQKPLFDYLDEKKKEGAVSEAESYFVVNMVYARLDAELVDIIADRPDVSYVYHNSLIENSLPAPEETFEPLRNEDYTWNLKNINVPEVMGSYEIDGSGVVIGIIDTGVCLDHPAIKENWRGYDTGDLQPAYNWYDPIKGRELPDDGNGHGTSVTGASLGKRVDQYPQIGVAPGAQWIAARGMPESGSGLRSKLLDAAQFMLAPTDENGKNEDPTMAPDIVVNAWGADIGEDDWFRDVVNNWRCAGIMPLFAAGNSGPSDFSIHNPANYPESFAVGSVDINNELSSFSSRGPGAYGEMIKPELVAPGEDVVLASAGGGYGVGDGTSFAAPHVAGVAALLLEANPELSVPDIEAILKKTANPLTEEAYPDIPNYGYGYGLVNALRAVDSIFIDDWTVLDGPEEAVELDGAWRINFNRPYEIEEVVGIAIDRNNGIVPVSIDYLPEEKEAIVSPEETYLPGEEYELRIYLSNSKRYKVYFDTAD